MKCKEAKKFLRPEAIKFYLKARPDEVYHFMSLYNDNEPYPLTEVIQLQAEKLSEIEAEAREFEQFLLGTPLNRNDYERPDAVIKARNHNRAVFLKSQALSAKKVLNNLIKIQGKLNGKTETQT